MEFGHAKDYSQKFTLGTTEMSLHIRAAVAGINDAVEFPIRVKLFKYYKNRKYRVMGDKSEEAVWLGEHLNRGRAKSLFKVIENVLGRGGSRPD